MTKTIQANCNECGGERNAFVRASHSVRGDNEYVVWGVMMEILECCGCNNLSMRRKSWIDAEEAEITYWPPKQSYAPSWIYRLPDDNLRQTMEEVYVALNQGIAALASIGVEDVVRPVVLYPLGERS